MRNGFKILLLVLTMHSAFADPVEDEDDDGDIYGPDFFPGYLCDDCRDPDEYPMDYVAFVHNGYFGLNAWMWESELGVPFRIYALSGEWVVAWFEGIAFDLPSFYPNLMNVMVRRSNGQVLRFTIVQSTSDLTIGSAEDSGCSCAWRNRR